MRHRPKPESGAALIAALLVILVFTVMMLGFYFVTTSEQKVAASDRDYTVSYYGAMGALEKMSSDLATFFAAHASPVPSQIDALTGASYKPNSAQLPGVNFPANGYTISCLEADGVTYATPCASVGSTLLSTQGLIQGTGPLAGLQGIITKFQLAVTVDGPNDTEVKLTRQVQEVAVPVFQYGIFSESDLSFFAGPDFGFGGRVHTNGNLFLAEGDNKSLFLNDLTTAYKDVIRTQLSNGYSTSAGGYGGTVDVLTASGGCGTGLPACRALGTAEGSLVGGPGSDPNSNWTTLSKTTYNGWILNGATGAKKLNLALALAGANASPVAIIQRPAATCPATCEDPTGTVGSSRLFNQASLRILLSNSTGAIMALPSVDAATQPLPLDSSLNTGGVPTLPTDSCHPPVALSPGNAADGDYMSPANTPLLGGYIKIEMQLQANPGTWKDVTAEILGLGISRDVQSGAGACASNRSILHLEEEKPGVPSYLSLQGGGSIPNGTTYYYTVTAVGPWGETAAGFESSVRTTANNQQIIVTWPALAGATSYNVYRATASWAEAGYFNVAACCSFVDLGNPTTNAGAPPTTILTSLANTTSAYNFVPINLYDTREGEVRDVGAAGASLNGIMNILEIDVRNLQQWFAGAIGASGTQALNSSGYILYVSDRRGNLDAGNNETGEYGNEDTINPASAAGTPNGTLDPPEDVDGDGIFRTYGATPQLLYPSGGTYATFNPQGNYWWTGTAWSTIVNSVPGNNPAFVRIGATAAQKNAPVVFRRAVRLVNGTAGNLPPLAVAAGTPGASGGFTVAAENPIYVQGDYNASVANGFADTAGKCHVPAAVIGDAVTLLSNNWAPGARLGANLSGDANSFVNTTNMACGKARCAATTYYRMAIMGGKNISFAQPAWGANDAGTDGGTHNFLRYIENWGNSTLNYSGSLASFHFARQATGIYKCCNTVYSPPTRAYKFDTDFQNISKLPPGTPRFTDVNALSAQQAIYAAQ